MKRSIATLSLVLTLHLVVGISSAEDLEIVPTTGNEVSEVLVEKRELNWVPGQIEFPILLSTGQSGNFVLYLVVATTKPNPPKDGDGKPRC